MNTMQVVNPNAFRELAQKMQEIGDSQKQLLQTQALIRDHIRYTKREQLSFTVNFVQNKMSQSAGMTQRFFLDLNDKMTS